MVVNGTSYAALGWRPITLTKSCKNFPQIGPKIDQRPVSEAKSEPEPKVEPEAISEPEPTVKLEPSSETESKAESEPRSEPEPESTSEPEPTTIESVTVQNSKYRKSLYTRSAAGPAPLMLTAQPVADVVETSVSFHVSKKQSKYFQFDA